VPGNAWEAQAYGKCNRKNTANLLVRVKWWGKSSPLNWRQLRQCKPQPEAKPNRNPIGLLAWDLGRLLEYYGNIISR